MWVVGDADVQVVCYRRVHGSGRYPSLSEELAALDVAEAAVPDGGEWWMQPRVLRLEDEWGVFGIYRITGEPNYARLMEEAPRGPSERSTL